MRRRSMPLSQQSELLRKAATLDFSGQLGIRSGEFESDVR